MKSVVLPGLVLAFAGVGSFAAGGYLLKGTLDRQGIQSKAIASSERACREQVVKLGKVTPSAGDVLEVEVSDVPDTRAALAQATSMLAMCPTRRISEMCLGTGCAAKGAIASPVRMTVKLAGGKK